MPNTKTLDLHAITTRTNKVLMNELNEFISEKKNTLIQLLIIVRELEKHICKSALIANAFPK